MRNRLLIVGLGRAYSPHRLFNTHLRTLQRSCGNPYSTHQINTTILRIDVLEAAHCVLNGNNTLCCLRTICSRTLRLTVLTSIRTDPSSFHSKLYENATTTVDSLCARFGVKRKTLGAFTQHTSWVYHVDYPCTYNTALTFQTNVRMSVVD